MITKTFICDVCKKSVGEKELCPVEIKILLPTDKYTKSASCNKDVCKKCLKVKGIIVDVPEEKKTETLKENDKTLENKLIEFLENLGVVFE